MSEQGKTISRQELYEAVWRSPISKLAPAWGTTIAAIIKACEKMKVPRPEAGHWALVRRGWEMERASLPEADVSTKASVVLEPPRKKERAPKQTQEQAPAEPLVKITKDFSRTHPLVKQTRRAYRSDTYIRNGFVNARAHQDVRLSLTVSPEQVDRALLICDAIIHGVIVHGVRVQAPGTALAKLMVGKQPVGFWIREGMKRSDLDLTDEEKKARGLMTWDRFDWKGTGVLRLTVEVEGYFSRMWQDSKRLPLDVQLGEIIAEIGAAEEEAQRIKEEREAYRRKCEEEWRREQEARRREEERKREIEERRRAEEENRNRLMTMARNWREARLVRRFIRRCEGMLASGAAGEGWQAEWLTWAKAHADRIDPMTNGYLELERQRITAPP